MLKKHPILKIMTGLLAVILLAGVITGIVILANGAEGEGEFQYLLVLGTTVEGSEPSSMLRDRIEKAYDYLSTHENVVAVLSGYRAEGAEISEAECMFRELTEMGISPERLILEPQATSTVENFAYSLKLMEEHSGSKPECIGVLSSEFHLLRAKMFAEEHNVEIVTIPAKTSDFGTLISYFLREIVMVWYYGIF